MYFWNKQKSIAQHCCVTHLYDIPLLGFYRSEKETEQNEFDI